MTTATTNGNGKASKDSKTNMAGLAAVPAGTEMRIPIGMIVADDDFNARKNIDGEDEGGHDIKSLAKSIKVDGQLSPVMVAFNLKEYPGKYFLISGYRRFYAISRSEEEGGLGGKMILATVYQPLDKKGEPMPVSLGDLKYLNLIENEARKSLNPYERALRYHDLVKNHEETGSQIAKRISLDPSYVNRLIAAMDMHPALIAKWAEEWSPEFTGKSRLMTSDVINKLTHMRLKDKDGKATDRQDHESQYAWLQERLAPVVEESDDEGDEGEGEGAASPGDKRTSLAQIKKAMEAAKFAYKETKNAKEQERIQGVIDALKFCMKAQKIDGVLTVHDDGKVIKNVNKEAVAAPKS